MQLLKKGSNYYEAKTENRCNNQKIGVMEQFDNHPSE